jgi:hypothetical protein
MRISDTVVVLVLVVVLLVLVAGVPLVAGCGSPRFQTCSAEPGTSRCAGTEVQVCAPDGVWVPVTDCATLTPGAWECSPEGCYEARP